MQTSTKCTPSYFDFAFMKHSAEDNSKDISNFQFKEDEFLKIDLSENENSYSNIYVNSDDSFIFKDSNDLSYQNILQINDNFDNKRENIFSKENSDKKDESSSKENKDNNTSNEECLFPLNLENNFGSNSSLNKPKKNKKINFDVIYPKKNDFEFNRSKNTKSIIFIKMKMKMRRRDKKDNILLKIKRTFFNTYLYNIINTLVLKKWKGLKKGKGSHKFFYRFSKKFIIDMTKKNNKRLLDMTLRQIIENDSNQGNKLNSDFLPSLQVEKNDKLEELLNSKYNDLFEIYINSQEFENEINRLKVKGFPDYYIKLYIYLSKNFIKFFEGNNEI